MDHPRVLRLPAHVKAQLKVMFLAKHALGEGRLHHEDGSHAVYHHELLSTLRSIGLDVVPANSYAALAERPDVDFVVTLLNRGGFSNSEMLAPLLLTKHRIPFLGASPIIRGLADDKHLAKMAARHHGVPTAPWAVHRRGAGKINAPGFRYERLVVKPNASSASWGVKVVDTWFEGLAHVEALHAQGHDVIIEPWVPLIDVAVPVVGSDGPWMLPPLAYMPKDPERVRSYEEKRNLINVADDPLEPIEDAGLRERLATYTAALMRELWPFDYGRFEFRYDPKSGALQFMEVNLSCNLWSRKTISRSAALLGVDHQALVETIVTHSLQRQGLLHRTDRLAA